MENAVKILEAEIKNQQSIIREKVLSGESIKENELIIGEMNAAIEKLKPKDLIVSHFNKEGKRESTNLGPIEFNMDSFKNIFPSEKGFWKFDRKEQLEPLPVEDWVVSDTTDFSELFKNCQLKDPTQGIKHLDTEGNVQTMFENAEKQS